MTYDKDSFLAGLSVGMLLGREYHGPKHYLTFESEDSSEFSLSVYNSTKNWDGTLYYSTDGETWTVWDGTVAISSIGGVLCLRGTGNTVITGSDSELSGHHWVLPYGKRIQCIGNVEYLLDWETVAVGQHPLMANYCYRKMFRACTSLTSAPALPSTTLASHCYGAMFSGCTSLTSAPALPATTLASYCYESTFSGCTSLTSAPALPATTLAEFCYANMFHSCTSLTSAPALPATTLPRYCYDCMFMNCRNLTSAPAISATTLALFCCSDMFRNCTSLTEIPELPATTMAARCYMTMFQGCRALKISETQDATYQYEYRIPPTGIGTDTSPTGLDGMFYSTGGSFKGTPSINTTYYTDHPPVPAA